MSTDFSRITKDDIDQEVALTKLNALRPKQRSRVRAQLNEHSATITSTAEAIKEMDEMYQTKSVSRGIIYRRLSRSEAIFDEVPVGASILWAEDTTPDLEVMEALVDWSMQQTNDVATLVMDFLENPSDESVALILQQLADLGIQLHSHSVQRSRPLSQIMLEALHSRPHSIDELYTLARAVQPSNRPEAAVRQLLRRMKKNHVLAVTDEDLVYLLSPEE